MAEKRTAKKASTKSSPAKASTRKNPAKKASADKATKKKDTAKSSTKKASTNNAGSEAKLTRDSKTKDPRGGLTQAGREYFNKKEGSHLKPGVKGPADTPEKQKRKGSFLRRHFANPRGPMEKDGQPTRLALSAQAWGEPLPRKAADAKKLAAKGAKLLEAYAKAKDA